MDLRRKISACFYTITLSLWSIALPYGDFYGQPRDYHVDEVSAEIAEYHVQPDHLYLISYGSSNPVNFQTNSSPYQADFFNESAFHFLFLKSAYSSALALTEAIDVKFEFIDLIFPFHYFW